MCGALLQQLRGQLRLGGDNMRDQVWHLLEGNCAVLVILHQPAVVAVIVW
jgi:hypothetical protein